MGFAKVKGPLTSRIGQPVKFSPPKDVGLAGGSPSSGRIVDEVWANDLLNTSPPRTGDPKEWGDYSFFAQLIEWTDSTHQVRLGYYRRRIGEDHWEFASQMTVCTDPETVKTLCERLLGKAHWFKR